nr:UbiA family prenyltransferase [uncultured Desulfobacter sp.]
MHSETIHWLRRVDMPKKLRTYLELVRLPGVFTAHADIFAGFLIAGLGVENISSLLWLLGASSCFFSAGMALNDFFDADNDRIERPERPIPSGRISRQSAFTLGMVLLVAGMAFAYTAGSGPFYAALGLAAMILLYDGVFKSNSIAGPLCMGACRYFNLLMVLALQPFEGWALIPVIPFIYIVGVTVLSRKEVQGGRAVAHISICTLALGLASSWAYLLFLKGVFHSFLGILMIMVLTIFLSSRVLGLLDRHSPKNYQSTMKLLLMALIALDFILASTRTPVYFAALILLLYIPAVKSVRLFKVT